MWKKRERRRGREKYKKEWSNSKRRKVGGGERDTKPRGETREEKKKKVKFLLGWRGSKKARLE